MKNNSQQVFKLAKQQFKALQTWRRQIHRQPELGFEEKKTAALVAGVCREAGWRVTTKVAKTGVVAVLGKKESNRCIAIRADMDALPIQEKNTHNYKSCVANMMHACGHDGNTTMALGAAVLLGQCRDRINGQVKLFFQPCEEVPPGGAQAMIKAGALTSPKPDVIIAPHIDAKLPLGTIGVKSGVIMANVGAFKIKIYGKGGHAAMPHQCVDPITIAAQVISNLQHIVSRESNPLQPEVVTIGKINGGFSYNSIADEVELAGTIRSLSKKERISMPKQIKRIVTAVAKAHRAEAELIFESGHPALINDKNVVRKVERAALHTLGKGSIVEFENPAMSGEDFTYFAEQVPSCFFHVGAGFDDQEKNFTWHHPRFDFDERALINGTAVLTQTVLDYLK